MQAFRTEVEDQVIEKDILDLEKNIHLFREGKIEADKFRPIRLLRGVYGQRQQGVQMVRIKIPFGKVSANQLSLLADIAEEYSNGSLHLTTRQDVQIYYVSLETTTELWAKLEQGGITIREAGGNTVRNITASSLAGIDPKEPFDITSYATALFRYLLRNPVQDTLGRKFKIAFSSGDDDTALTLIHDLGFIPKVKIIEGKITRGFKVLIGGGLGAQPFLARTASEFLPAEELIPFSEAVIRVFGRYGERNNRHKARIKYLITKTGLEEFLRLVDEEKRSLTSRAIPVTVENSLPEIQVNKDPGKIFTTLKVSDENKYRSWMAANTFEQKQQGFFAAGIKLPLGNIPSEKARALAGIAKKYSEGDLRITVNQGFLLRFVPRQALPALYRELNAAGLAETGFDSIADITACPGTDTCNLGITSSTGIARELEKVIRDEFPELIYDKDMNIKISGCINSCGQHGIASIGFHGSTFKAGTYIVPALQVLLAGGVSGNGLGRFADKIIKVPSKRGPAVLREILNDFLENSGEEEKFNSYFDRKGRPYFEELLKPHADLSTLGTEDYKDWGYEEFFKPSIGIGECAGITVDLVDTLFYEAEEKLDAAKNSLNEKLNSDSVYHSYSAFIQVAKALLLTKQVPANSHIGIINEFEKQFAAEIELPGNTGFKELVLRINQHEADELFARMYLSGATEFLSLGKQYRAEMIRQEQTESVNT
jgi:sulfite reductase (ferredoxin)